VTRQRQRACEQRTSSHWGEIISKGEKKNHAPAISRDITQICREIAYVYIEKMLLCIEFHPILFLLPAFLLLERSFI